MIFVTINNSLVNFLFPTIHLSACDYIFIWHPNKRQKEL